MSISKRRLRVDVYAYTAATDDDGVAVTTYVRTLSGDDDGQWWAGRSVPSGRSRSPALQAEHEWDTSWNLAGECPITQNGVIRYGAELYRVLVVLPRDVARDERQVLAIRVDDADATFNLTEPV